MVLCLRTCRYDQATSERHSRIRLSLVLCHKRRRSDSVSVSELPSEPESPLVPELPSELELEPELVSVSALRLELVFLTEFPKEFLRALPSVSALVEAALSKVQGLFDNQLYL